MRHTNIMEYWADLMNKTKGQVAGWLENAGYKTLPQLEKYLRPNQIAAKARGRCLDRQESQRKEVKINL